jgi:hypothetical protein
MTEAQRNAITTPATGLIIYNMEDDLLQFYDGTGWVNVGGGGAMTVAINDLTDAYKDFTTRNNLFMGHAGVSLLAAGTPGTQNVVIGRLTGTALTSGSRNTLLGDSAGESYTSASDNIVIGMQAAQYNTDGYRNVVIGNYAGRNSGLHNVYVGERAGRDSTGSGNTYVGRAAGQNHSSGSSNIIIGEQDESAIFNSGTGNILIGRHVDTSAATASRQLNIGNTIFGILDDTGTPAVVETQIGLGVVNAASINASALLELSSTTRGFLPPRMTEAQRNAIATPATGLMVYNTDEDLLQFFDGTNWVNVGVGSGSGALDDLTDVLAAGAIAGNIIKFNGTNWVLANDIGGEAIFNGNLLFTAGSYGNWGQLGSSTVYDAAGNFYTNVLQLSGNRFAILWHNGADQRIRTFDFDGTNWSAVGNTFNGVGYGGAIARLNATDIAIRQPSTGEIRTLRFDGTNWGYVGSGVFVCGDGSFTALNSNTVAVVCDNGETRVYSWSGANWSQVGGMVDFSAAMYDVSITALSSNTIAVVTNSNDQIRTFNWNGTTWTQVGNTFTAEVDFNDAKVKTLASNMIAIRSNTSGGMIRTYVWDGTDWSLESSDFAPITSLEFGFTGVDATNIVALVGSTVRWYTRTSGTNTIADNDATGTLGGLVSVNNRIRVSGSASNDRIFTISGVTNSNTITVIENVITEGPVPAIINLIDSVVDLDGLVDVDVSGATNGQCLIYNSVSGNWEAGECDAAGNTSQWTNDGSGNIYNTEGGSVGIGTGATPNASAALELASTTRGFLPPRMTEAQRNAITTPATGLMVFNTTSGTLQFWNGTGWTNVGGGVIPSRIQDADNNTHIEVNTAADGSANTIVFTNNAVESMRISNAGYVGIGTNNPSYALHVAGDIAYTGTLYDLSDIRLKTDIVPIDRETMFERLMDVDTYSFRMKDDPQQRIEFGVMAQELEKLFPELVNTADDEMGTKSVNYIGLITPLIEASKALKEENLALKAELQDIRTAQAEILEQVHGLSRHTGFNHERASFDKWLMALMIMVMGAMMVMMIRRRV